MKWDYKACLHYGFGLNPDQAKTRFTQVTRVCTRPRLMRVPSMSTARIMLKSDGTSAYWQCMSSFDHSSMVQRSRTSETLCSRGRVLASPVSTHFQPTYMIHMWVNLGSTRIRKTESSADVLKMSSTRVRALVRPCMLKSGPARPYLVHLNQ